MPSGIKTPPELATTNTIKTIVESILDKDGEVFVKESIREIIEEILKMDIKARVDAAVKNYHIKHPDDLVNWLVGLARDLKAQSGSSPPTVNLIG
jgi:hypothetical protein